MIATLLAALLGPRVAVSLPRYALLVAGGAQLVAVLAVFTWLTSLAELAGGVALDVVAGLAGCAGHLLAAIEGA